MIANTKVYGRSLDGDMNDVFFNSYAESPSEYEAIFKVESAPAGNHYKASEISPLGSLREVPEGTAIQFDTPVEGHTKTVYYTAFGLGFQLTRQMAADDLFGKVKGMASDLGAATTHKINVEAFDLFNSGFTAQTAWDGQYIFDTDHSTLKSGETIANKPATAGSLTETTLQAAFEYFYGLKGESGRPLRMMPYMLIVPEAKRAAAFALNTSEKQLGNANNDPNYVKPGGVLAPSWGVHVSRYLTSTTAWFLIAREHNYFMYWKERPEFDSGDDFFTGNALFKVWTRFSVFCLDYKGGYGNAGV